MRQRLIRFSVGMMAAALMAGCASTVSVEPQKPLPRALMTPLPVSVGVVIDDGLRNFRHEESRGGTNWKVNLGPGHVRLVQDAFSAAFREARMLGSVDEARGHQDLAAVFVPAIEQYSFATPRDTTGGHWAATLRYRLAVYGPMGERVDTLTLSGYGSARDVGGARHALGTATFAAMRDAAAKFLVQFPQQPLAVHLREGRPLEPQALASVPVDEIEMVPVDP